MKEVRHHITLRHVITAILVTAVIIAGTMTPSTAEDMGAFELRVGEAVFIDGLRNVPTTLTGSPNAATDALFCEQGLQTCFDYHLALVEAGERLRVSLDASGSGLQVYLFDPSGVEVAQGFVTTYNSDLIVDRPIAGTWTYRVIPFSENPTSFRIRARLEGENHGPPPVGNRLLLPNLRMQPPFAFTLETPGGGTGFMDIKAGRGIPPTAGCLPTEIVTYRVTRCLRFSTGPENVGLGRLELLFAPEGGDLLECRAFQLIERSDGTTEQREAGEYVYHVEHTHFHHAGFAGFELLSVTDAEKGGLVPAGTGPKQGFCMAPIRIADWFAFDNALEHVERRNCNGIGDDPTTRMSTGLARGWADIYAYYQEGNFVDFGDNPDGVYVVRVHANDRDAILETTSRDNTSYALVEITGHQIEVVERGYGTDPWDPQKRVVEDLVPLTVRR